MKDREAAEEHFKRGWELAWGKNDFEGAISEFQRALACSSDIAAKVHHQFGKIYFHGDPPKLEEAIQEFQKVVNLKPEWCEGHFSLAGAMEKKGDLAPALKEYQIALHLNAKDTRVHFGRGYCLYALGHYKEAIIAFRDGLRLNPPYGELYARFVLGEALAKFGKVKEAIKEWTIIVDEGAVWDYDEETVEAAKKRLAEYKE